MKLNIHSNSTCTETGTPPVDVGHLSEQAPIGTEPRAGEAPDPSDDSPAQPGQGQDTVAGAFYDKSMAHAFAVPEDPPPIVIDAVQNWSDLPVHIQKAVVSLLLVVDTPKSEYE